MLDGCLNSPKVIQEFSTKTDKGYQLKEKLRSSIDEKKQHKNLVSNYIIRVESPNVIKLQNWCFER